MKLSSSHRDLINAANILEGLVNGNQKIYDENSFKNYFQNNHDIFVLVAANQNLFDFSPNDVFTISDDTILECIYGHKDRDYIGFRNSFFGNKFICQYEVKDKYQPLIDQIISSNNITRTQIENLKKENLSVGAFQTRNLPHFGHEKIIEYMLAATDHVIVNPLIGPKKSGDFQIEDYTYELQIYLDYKYNGQVTLMPTIANMFYAGPKEAFHHAKIRQNLGFTHFSVGRDHAGANKKYNREAAINFVNETNKSLDIQIIAHKGAVYCAQCKSAVLIGDCTHAENQKSEISGSEFRNCIAKGERYNFAGDLLQKLLLEKK